MHESEESDASLVRRARVGDVAALDMLLRRHARAAYLVSLAQLGEHADAEDACQDAFVRCVEHLDECRSPDRFASWLMQIVRNTAHNRRDHLRVREVEPLSAHADLRSDAHSDGHAIQADQRAALLRALTQVTPLQREIVLLHDLDGMQHAEIADRSDISTAMSRRHLSDARRTLRAHLTDHRSLEPDHD